jgi:hypothetical protein
MNRRAFLGVALIPLAQALDRQPIRRSPRRGRRLRGRPPRRRRFDPRLERIVLPRVVNKSGAPVRVKEVVLFDVDVKLPPETGLYGEGFQMLTQVLDNLDVIARNAAATCRARV